MGWPSLLRMRAIGSVLRVRLARCAKIAWARLARWFTYLQVPAFLLSVAAALLDTSAWLPAHWALAIRISGTIAIAYFIRAYMAKCFKRRVRTSMHEAKDRVFHQNPRQRAEQLQAEIARPRLISFEQAEVFTRAIVEASKLQQRIAEQYKPNQRTLHQEVTLDIQIPARTMARLHHPGGEQRTPPSQAELEAMFFYPVVVPPKGVLYDDLRVADAHGGTLTTLSYREYVHIAASALHVLLAVAFDAPPDNLPRHVVDSEIEAIWGIIRRVDGRDLRAQQAANAPPKQEAGKAGASQPSTTSALSPGAEPADGRHLARTLEELHAKSVMEGTENGPGRKETRQAAIRLAAQLVQVLSSNYAIVVETPAPASGRFAITYTCRLIPELDLAPRTQVGSQSGVRRKFRTWQVRLNILLGTRPVDVKLSLDNAWTCQSYHVLVHCPEGLYLEKQELITAPGYLERTAKGAPSPPHYRFRRRLGQSYAHFYGRFLPEPNATVVRDQEGRIVRDEAGNVVRKPGKKPKLILGFEEVPPGSLCRAALAAIAAAALIWIIGYGLEHVRGGVLEGTDAPAVLLAFPGVAASWLGFDSATHRLFEGTLTARLSLACTALVSLTATGLYLLLHTTATTSHPGARHTHGSAGLKIAILGIAQWPWIVLVVLALFNATYLSFRWLGNSWRFRVLAARDDPAGVGAVVGRHADSEDQATEAGPSRRGPAAPRLGTQAASTEV